MAIEEGLVSETDFNQLLHENEFLSLIASLNTQNINETSKNMKLIVEWLKRVRWSLKNQINNQKKDLNLLYREDTWKVLICTIKELVDRCNDFDLTDKLSTDSSDKFVDSGNYKNNDNDKIALKLGLKVLQLYTAIIPKSIFILKYNCLFIFYSFYSILFYSIYFI